MQRRMIRHVIQYRDGRTLIDRQTLAQESGRSVHTIRARCPIVDHDPTTGKALYDMDQCVEILATIKPRQRGQTHTAD